MGIVFLPTLIGTVIELIRKPAERDWLVHLIMTGNAAGRPIVLALLGLVMLPYDTLICLDAILRSGVRMLFTRRGLLLWQLRAYARRNARRTLVDFFVEMWIAPVLALSMAWALWQTRAVEWFLWVPVLLLWLVNVLKLLKKRHLKVVIFLRKRMISLQIFGFLELIHLVFRNKFTYVSTIII